MPSRDIEQYLDSEDAKMAEPWQLDALCSLREKLPMELSVEAYSEIRAVLRAHAERNTLVSRPVEESAEAP